MKFYIKFKLIFSDVAENNNEYIVLKNNQPTAVVISVQEYKNIQEKIARFENFLEKIEEIQLLKTAETRDTNSSIPFDDFIKSEGISIKDIEKLVESVEIE